MSTPHDPKDPLCSTCGVRKVGWTKKRADGSKVYRKLCNPCRGNTGPLQRERLNVIARHGLHCDECSFEGAAIEQFTVAGDRVFCRNCAAIRL